jgi:hypothetical protein
MADREGHLRQVERFEAFLKQINTPTQTHREWVVIVWFHISLHYIDAFLAQNGWDAVEGHSGRWSKMPSFAETRALSQDFHRLYKDAKEARYEGGEYTPLDMAPIEKRYLAIRTAMRKALSLSP